MTFTLGMTLTADAKGAKAELAATAGEAKKVTAATTEMGTATKTAGAGAQVLAAGAQAATTATERLGNAEAAAAGKAVQMGRTHQLAAGQVGNLTAQFNDIGMMLMAGQNPLQLAIQQGTQISQVIGPMGAAGAVRALTDAFMGMLNPVNLVIYAAIAGGAAFVQWAMSGEEAANSLIDDIKSVGTAIDDVRAKTAQIKFGVDNASVAAVMDQMLMIDAQLKQINEQYRMSDSLGTRQRLAEEAGELKNQYAELSNIVAAYQAAKAEQDAVTASVEAATQRIHDFTSGAFGAADAVGQIGARAAGVYGQVSKLASAIWNAANAKVTADAYIAANQKGGTAYLANQYSMYGSGRAAVTTNTRETDDLYGSRPTTSSGTGSRGGSGGAAAINAERDAMAELIAKEQLELDILRESDPVQKELLRHRDAMKNATAAERTKLEELIAARMAEKDAATGAQSAWSMLADGATNALDAILFKSKSAGDAVRELARTILQAAGQAFLSGSGPLAGLFGISGGLFGGGGKSIPLFAGGGQLVGPGTGTSDSILMYGSTGEFMVNAKSTAKHLPLLEAINAGAPLPRFARGGRIGGSGAGSSGDHGEGAGPVEFHIHVNGARGNSEISEMIEQGVGQALTTYDREVVPARFAQISRDPGKVG